MDFADALAGLPGVTVLSADADKAGHLMDFRQRYRGEALAVVLPSSTEAVAACIRLCAAHGVRIFPQGGNTSLCGGSVPPATGDQAIVLNLSRMNAVLAIDATDNAITVQAGCILQDVQEAAAGVGRLFPLSLGAEGSCQIGGNIATNAGGTGVLRYGNMRDLVLGLEVVLPSGEIWNGLQALRKNNTGYDLKGLFIGSEGTLGIITAATLKLFPRPRHCLTAMLAIGAIGTAVAVARDIQVAFAGDVTALELLSGGQYAMVLQHIAGAQDPLATAGDWYVLIELSAQADEAVLAERLSDVLAAGLADGTIRDAAIATSERQRQAMWHLRHHAAEANRRAGMGLTHDVAVPLARIPDFVERAGNLVTSLHSQASPLVIAHLGDGNLHYIAMFARENWAQVVDGPALVATIAEAIHDLAVELGGTFSAEHGIGRLRLNEMRRYKSPVELALMRGIKALVDPLDLMNPGRVLPGFRQ